MCKKILLVWIAFITSALTLNAQNKITIQSDATWKTTASAAAGWEQPGFNDASWIYAASPSPGNCGYTGPDMWHPSGPPTAFFRKEFVISDGIDSIDYRVFGVDDDADVYINGVLIVSDHDCLAGDLNLADDLQSYLKKGTNTIAIKATDCGYCWGVWIDFDIYTQTKITIQADATWKTITDVAPGWEQPGFNDAAWISAASPSPDGCGFPGPHMWHPSGSQTAYFRKEFIIADNIDSIVFRPWGFGADDDADVYINGVLAISNHDCWATDFNFTGLQSNLKKGVNTIAIKATDCGYCYSVWVDFDIYTSPCSLAKPVIISSGITTDVCPGKKVTLDAGAGYSTYLWNTNAATRTITVNAAGIYSVTVTDGSGCSATSDPKTVTYQSCPKPSSPLVTNVKATGARLSWTPPASCAVGYQLQYRKVGTAAWTTVQQTASFKNVTGLLPATTYQWQLQTGCRQTPPIGSGNIQCPNFTTAAAISSVGTESLKVAEGDLRAALFPNPAKDYATLQLSGFTGKVTIKLTDMAGKILWQKGNVDAAQLQIPVSKFSNGSYLVTITGGKETRTLKLIKD